MADNQNSEYSLWPDWRQVGLLILGVANLRMALHTIITTPKPSVDDEFCVGSMLVYGPFLILAGLVPLPKK